MLISDFEKHFLSGFPAITQVQKDFNVFKKRFDGFFFAGRDTYRQVIQELREKEFPLKYHNHRLNLKLNQIKGEPGFECTLKMDCFSQKVHDMRRQLFDMYQIEQIRAPKPRDAWFSIEFKPAKIDADRVADMINAFKVPRTLAKCNKDGLVQVCFSMEVAQVPDYELNNFMSEELKKSGINLNGQIRFQSTATA